MKRIHIIGGGTFSHVRCHLSLAVPAFGSTARRIHRLLDQDFKQQRLEKELDTELHLTRMAGGGALITNDDVSTLVDFLVADPTTGMIIFNPALVDFDGKILQEGTTCLTETTSGKHEPRLKSRNGSHLMRLSMSDKIIGRIRKERKDIFLVGFKTTAGATEDEQYFAGLGLLKDNSCNLVLANDIFHHRNMIVTPEEARYCITEHRDQAIYTLVNMALQRYGLTFNRTQILPGEPVSWDSERIPDSLRTVVDWCIEQGAYKPIRGKTVGHFSYREGENKFLVSRRKVDFTKLDEFGMVEVEIDNLDGRYRIYAYGSKPSAGAQTQRLIFEDHPEYDCIIHFHCPLKKGSKVPVRPQYAYECGSIECGTNTSRGLRNFGNLGAVMLDKHGPNIVFNSSINPQEVIQFIREHCDLSQKTGGYDAAWAGSP